MKQAELSSEFWNARYKEQTTGWDLGQVSPPLKAYFDQLTDKNLKILIPGCGNGYEGEYLYKKGFENVYLLDFAPLAVENFKKRFPNFPESHLYCKDFFQHNQTYDLIIEQTFFCALNPSLRKKYVSQMHCLLRPGGKLAGLLFNIPLNEDQPPFGGSKSEYKQLFSKKFDIKTMETAYNSIEPRKGNELFFIAQRKN
jgi:SAM-dependent methyltransferase